jgi:hypothetical protein
MNVTVQTQCGRCGKKDNKEMSLGAAQELETAEKNREQNVMELKLQLEQLLTDEHPDLIVLSRTSNGYDVNTLDNMCDAPDAKRNRGCASRVKTLVNEMFLLNGAAPKKKRAKKAKANKSEEADIPQI